MFESNLPCNIKRINERLEIFISSAQSDEGDLSWKQLRIKLKNRLQSCPFFNPFIFEDASSSIPSNQRYEYQVIRSDIVVLLLKDEVRPGTNNEYQIVKKNKKPLLLYFIGNSKNLQIQSIKKEIQENDFCSYKVIDYADLDKLDENIFSAIYSDLILKFRNLQLSKEQVDVSIKDMELINFSSIITTEQIFLYFKNYYDSLYSYYILKKSSDENDFIINMFYWLVTGKSNNLKNVFKNFSDSVKIFFDDNNWFIYRWMCFFSYNEGDIPLAINHAEKAFEIVQERKMPEWLITNILLDIRNLAFEANDREKYLKYQKLLDNNKNILFLPIVDRFASNIYNKLLKDELKFNIKSEYTISFGSNFKELLKEIENYFFISILYGSFTHMYITRKILFNVLYSYGVLFLDDLLLYESIKLLLLNSSTKDCEELIKKYWDLLYPIITTHSDELWLLSNELPLLIKQSTKIILIKQLSLYFSDNIYKEVKRFIITFYNENNEHLLSEYLDMILCNCHRLDNNIIIDLLLSLELSYNPLFFRKFIEILFELNLSSIAIKNHMMLKDYLKEHIELFVQHKINIQIITYLINYDNKIYGELEYIKNNGLIGIDKKIFDFKIKNKQTEIIEAIKEELVFLDEKIDNLVNSKQYEVTNYFYSYRYLLQTIPDKVIDNIREIFEVQSFDLITKTLHSPLPINIKDDALTLLALLINFSNILPQKIEKLLIDLQNDITDEMRFGLTSKKSYSLRKKILELIIKKDDYLLYSIQSDYYNFTFAERYTIIQTLFYFFCKFKNNNCDKSYLIMFVLNALNDKHEDIRFLSTNTLAYYLKYFFSTNYFDLLKSKAYDSSYKVRRTLLSLCEDHFFNNNYLIQILEILKNDLNYEIKTTANSLLECGVKEK